MVRVVICYFRSGGTLLNRCLSALPGIVVLSEVSPLKPGRERKQAAEWYGIDLHSNGFLDSVQELSEICEQTSRYLVLRLWVVGEFASGRPNDPAPVLNLAGYHSLLEKFGDVRVVAMVRDAIDIWISRGCRPRGFFANYRRYVEAILADSIPVEYYEALCTNSDAIIGRICRRLDIPFSENYRNFHSVSNVEGDISSFTSRGWYSQKILRLKRRRIRQEYIDFINSSEHMVAVNEALGYPTRYSGVARESVYTTVRRMVLSRLRTNKRRV